MPEKPLVSAIFVLLARKLKKFKKFQKKACILKALAI
jgi:hypothetical protein